MKHASSVLGAAIAAALAIVPAMTAAHPQASSTALTGLDTNEAPRVTKLIDNGQLSTLVKSHFGFLAHASTRNNIADSARMSHLQLVLKPSQKRQAAMEAFIVSQHDPKSAKFHQWLTPAQFGAAFGVEDADVAAAAAWLRSQGFIVNSVYPNRTQIDFSGTAGQVKAAFHTQEAVYTIGDEKHRANATDVSVPVALAPIVAGVMGLNDFHAQPMTKKPTVATWSPGKKSFIRKNGGAKPIAQALTAAGLRGLVPNDMMTMYGIRGIRNNGVTGAHLTIAVVEDGDMYADDWSNFTSTFNLQRFGGSFTQVNPAPPSGSNNCADPDAIYGDMDYVETVLDAEYATAIAPSAHIVVASCSDQNSTGGYATDNFFGGVFIAATNLINAGSDRPDIISASYGFGEFFTDSASKTAIDLMWAQADAEGISVFVSTGDSSSNPSFNGSIINGYKGNTAIDANAFATSAHVTGVGGTDTADILDGTTSKYFAPTPSVVGGSALSYVPEIPWNESCGNGVAAKAFGYSSVLAFCKDQLIYDPYGLYVTSEGGSGGPSSVDSKPAWQRGVYNAAKDQSRDLPDVSLFAGSYRGYTNAILCTHAYPCAPDFSTPVQLIGGTSLSAPMFAGIQALIDQGLAARGLPADQGNAAPTLYALAANQYGAAGKANPDIATCSADNGATGTAQCVFHNITRGSNSSNCYAESSTGETFTTPHCYYYGNISNSLFLGLTTKDAAPTSYGPANKAFPAQPGWSFANGLGSVNTENLLIAWRAFVHAPAATAAGASAGQ